ncbi:MAG: 4-hydroxy-tetrahydrodipicolinate reductase [Gemmatimonadaceae bacterium]|nr:4-hydroxy-tetrahydrodipicolinate reductase [Gemmatimonadaceae bacterium]
MIRVLLIGDGRMGRAIEVLARERGHTVVGVLGASDNVGGAGVAAWRDRADVAIEFTEPGAAVANVRACVAAGLPVVCGTTGWGAQQAAVEEAVWAAMGALLVAPNFSLGVALITALVEQAGSLFAPHPQYECALVETHHAAKKDAPSGTAIALRDAAQRALGREVPTTSVRVGSVPGTHALLFDGPFEQIVLSHEARDRRVFADGALRAAEWLVGRQGVFSMRDVLGLGRRP